VSVSREELQDAARRAFGEGGTLDAEASWGLIAEMGWLMMTVPEALGGLGLGGEAAGVIHTELGRSLVPGPTIAQLLTIEALVSAEGLEQRGALLERAMAGEVMTASLAGMASLQTNEAHLSTPPLSQAAPGSPAAQRAPASVEAGASSAGPCSLRCVPDADRGSHVLVIEPHRVALLTVDAARVVQRQTWDETRRLFDVECDDRAPQLVLAEGEAARALAMRLDAQLAFALAGDSLGAADAILEMTVEYLKTRRQYDRPLALFQALKHRVADMKTWLTAAEALFWAAASESRPSEVALGALKAHATNVAVRIAEESIQLHGGIGVTMEHPCHLFLKRVMLNAALGGDNDRLEEAAGRAALAAA
jgi:alkylation response protein AidB-like acyl-CoA dehydrogenase